MPAPQHSKVCNRCGQAQPLSNFSKGKGTCKPCRALLVMVASQAVPGPPPIGPTGRGTFDRYRMPIEQRTNDAEASQDHKLYCSGRRNLHRAGAVVWQETIQGDAMGQLLLPQPLRWRLRGLSATLQREDGTAPRPYCPAAH